jgi:hypothetical protein
MCVHVYACVYVCVCMYVHGYTDGFGVKGRISKDLVQLVGASDAREQRPPRCNL